MKKRIQNKINVKNDIVFTTTCGISYNSNKFVIGDYFHTTTSSINNNTLFTISSSTQPNENENQPDGKVFVVVSSNNNCISYSEDYGTLYHLCNEYNEIIKKLESLNLNISFNISISSDTPSKVGE